MTHRQLHSLVRALGADIDMLRRSPGDGIISGRSIAGLEQRSHVIKIRLRAILDSLQRPAEHQSIPDLMRRTAQAERE